MRRRRSRGFTLLEVLVATTIMAVAIGTLLAALTASVRNASRLTESDRAAVLAKRAMDQLLADPLLPLGQNLQGAWDIRETGLPAGWQARLEPFETIPNLGAQITGMERLVVEVWWMSGSNRRTFMLESYRPAPRRKQQ